MESQELNDYLSSTIKTLVETIKIGLNGLLIEVSPQNIIGVLEFLRDDPKFQCKILIDIFGSDYPMKGKRFGVIYNLLSIKHNFRVVVKVWISEREVIPTSSTLYESSVWYEREIWDMYGIEFKDNPDLRRILTDYGFEGHPLRKDFPLTGHVEVRYDPIQQKVIYEPVQLAQDFRKFDFMSPWEGTEYILPGDEKATR
jgi:NADH-quinone oxidoreductase subunit C